MTRSRPCPWSGRFAALLLIFALLLTIHPAAGAADGVTEDEIVLGQSCALSGPAGALGTRMRAGILAYLARINERGGIHGRTVRLVSLDDGYEPDRAIRNTRSLIEKERVFVLIGEVGTPTSKAVLPIAEESSVPFLAPFTGAEFLRHPYREHVVNLRASYFQEMERIASRLVDRRGRKRIACFYQNDAYGLAGLTGIRRALTARGLELVATGTYERNTLAVKGALAKIRRSGPDAVVMVGAYKPCAEFIRWARRIGMEDTEFCNISFVGTEALLAELGDDGEGCLISQVVPSPKDQRVPVVAAYLEDMNRRGATEDIGFVSLEGYLAAKLFCMAAERSGRDLTRRRLLDTFSSTGTFDLGGFTLRFGERDHQGSDTVFLTAIEDGRIREVGEDG